MESVLTVTAAASTFDLVTMARVKRRARITTTDDDDLLATLISEKSGEAADWCNRVFASETVSETIRLPWDWRHRRPYGELPRALMLQRFPVTAISSITEDGGSALTADDYELDGDSGLLLRLNSDGNRIEWCARKIVVAYTAGYTLATVPDALAGAVADMVIMDYRAAGRDPLIKAEATEGVGSVSYWVGGIPGQESGLPPEITRKLQPFRRIGL